MSVNERLCRHDGPSLQELPLSQKLEVKKWDPDQIINSGSEPSRSPSLEIIESVPEVLIAKRYLMERTPLGHGGFGEVFPGKDIHTEINLAIKTEHLAGTKRSLNKERLVYFRLGTDNVKLVGFPKIYYYGRHEGMNVLVMERLGRSLEDRLEQCGGRFSLKTTLMIGIQALERIEDLHCSDFVHRDIKPGNFATGFYGRKRVIYLFDLGLARRFRHIRSGNLRKPRLAGTFTPVGTLEFASIHAHDSKEQARRDDLESLGYTLVFLFKGKLPWTRKCCTGDCLKYVEEMKRTIKVSELCEGMPPEMQEYFNIVQSMAFEDEPDYYRLTLLFEKALKDGGHDKDWLFDWVGEDLEEE